MSKIPPFHSIREHVYHDDTQCPEAIKIQTLYKKQGTGAKEKCPYCKRVCETKQANRLPEKPVVIRS